MEETKKATHNNYANQQDRFSYTTKFTILHDANTQSKIPRPLYERTITSLPWAFFWLFLKEQKNSCTDTEHSLKPLQSIQKKNKEVII